MADATITYWDEESGLLFVWHGGAYIDYGYSEDGAYAQGWDGAYDVLNVWDDQAGVSYLEQDAARNGSGRLFTGVLTQFEKVCAHTVKKHLAELALDA